MSNPNYLEIDVNEQLKKIESFSLRHQQEMSELFDDQHSLYSTTVIDNANAVQNQVFNMMNTIETQIEQQLGQINEQLQNLAPNPIQ
ncbi:hypothetical protein ACFFUP_02560 [Vibrio ostreicida]|uniref:Uncharacterized protein n=1 Tax=Vibrio ostreicida TaxID=526588 RepID=A0ABT8BV91_9VIBR|nr:hypothetical protein [Vibrio ostreicida]MDN3610573.1 hypothetical protein [Vibrio ostreicida]NPD07427.1 hypothetical protein [Vibrio ostreicida]